MTTFVACQRADNAILICHFCVSVRLSVRHIALLYLSGYTAENIIRSVWNGAGVVSVILGWPAPVCPDRIFSIYPTEILWSTTGRRLHQLPQLPFRVGTDEVVPVSVVRDLGIYIDSDVSMRSHVAKTVSA